mgnify:FL=1
MDELQILKTTKNDVLSIDPRNIEPKEGFNGREVFDKAKLLELKDSIAINGVRVPISVRKIRGEERYQIVNGERRWRASMMLIEEGVQMRIPAIIFKGNDVDAIVAMLTTNDAVPFNLVEEAQVLLRLSKHGLSNKEISDLTGRKPSYISNLLKLTEAPHAMKKMVTDNKISTSLLMKIFREEKDSDTAAILIQNVFESMNGTNAVQEEGEPNDATAATKKITQRDINKAKGVTNSYSSLRKVFKVSEKENLVVKPAKQELYNVLKSLQEGKYTYEQLLEELFEQQ